MRRPPRTPGDVPRAAVVVPVRAPFRLDLTANVLRRLSTNLVDVLADGVYRRALGEGDDAALLAVRQTGPDALLVELHGPGAAARDPGALLARLLGTERTLDAWDRRAARIPWLAPLARAARGVRPPRYPSLWEAAVNAIVFQQVSIHAAAAILGRTIARTVRSVDGDGVTLHPFPPPERFLDAAPDELRACGLSVNKVVALRRVARALLDGVLDETALAARPTSELLAALVEHPGIGSWTAAVIALRGFGRLDVFPLGDSGAARAIRELSGDPSLRPEDVLDALGDARGMLYYHLLLGRLAARGEVALELPDR